MSVSVRNGWPLLAMSLLLLAAAPASAQSGYGQVQLINQMPNLILDLYVDGGYGCRANAGFTCTTQVPAGNHVLQARASDGQTAEQPISLESGRTFTWTISPSG